MRIENVEVLNYRQFRKVEFDFEPANSHDIHIILGNNGTGKTNLLNAISWCFYEKEPHLGMEHRAKKKINTAALQEAIQKKEEKCLVQVRVKVGMDQKKIIFDRTQEFRAVQEPFEYKPNFVVTVMASSGTHVLTDKDEIGNMVKQYLPEEISEYFFFDGEQLDQYFISNQGEKIHHAIYNISQVNLLHSMQERLGKVVRMFQQEAGRKNVGIKELNGRKERAETAVGQLEASIAECKKQYAMADSELTACNEYLAGKEGVPEKEQEYQDLARQLQEKEQEWEQHLAEFKEFLREYTILFSLYPKMKAMLDMINGKERQGELPPNIDKHFLEKMLKAHTCYICGRDMDSGEEEKVKKLLGQLQLSSEASHLLMKIKSPLEESIRQCARYPARREGLEKREKKIQNERKVMQEKFNKLDAFLKTFQDKGKVRQMHERRSKFMGIRQKNQEDIIRLEMQLGQAQKELKQSAAELSRAIESQKELKSLEQQINFAEKAKAVVMEIEEEMMGETKEEITRATMGIFQELDWKTETFSHIELDASYALELYDKYGYPMVGACSAAERALLALSFTLALQKVSGYHSMLFIDTPVGRVDLENRASFAAVLRQLSQDKQIIITFTPSEYSQEIRDILEPHISTFKELKTTDESEVYIG